jgi:hypothetical protein
MCGVGIKIRNKEGTPAYDIGIKYQFITLHNNTNIPCRLKKKKFKTCHIAIQQVIGHPCGRGLRKPHPSPAGQTGYCSIAVGQSHSSEH